MNDFVQKIWNVLSENQEFVAEDSAITALCAYVFHVPYTHLSALELLTAIKILAELHHRDDGESAPDITDYL